MSGAVIEIISGPGTPQGDEPTMYTYIGCGVRSKGALGFPELEGEILGSDAVDVDFRFHLLTLRIGMVTSSLISSMWTIARKVRT